MKQFKLGVLGCGNMAGAIIRGASNSSNDQFTYYTYTPSQTRAKALAADVGGLFVENLSQLRECDGYMLGCKPQQFEDMVGTLGPYLKRDSLLISLMASKSITDISSSLGSDRVVRVMPNTPSLISRGVSTAVFSTECSVADKKLVTSLFRSIGLFVPVAGEELIDETTPLTGSSPAFFFQLVETIESSLIDLGLDQETASKAAKEVFIGSAYLLDSRNTSAQNLRKEVTSKGGITEAALEVLSPGYSDLMHKALLKSRERSNQLKKS